MQVDNSDFKFSHGEKSRPMMAEINVTPFVDVMLVLLVIFMITTPLMQGMDVQLPKASAPSVEMQNIPTVSVKSDRKIYWNEDLLADMAALAQKVREYSGGDEKKELYFRADKSLDYGFVVGVFSEIRNAGIQNIGMVTEPPER